MKLIPWGHLYHPTFNKRRAVAAIKFWTKIGTPAINASRRWPGIRSLCCFTIFVMFPWRGIVRLAISCLSSVRVKSGVIRHLAIQDAENSNKVKTKGKGDSMKRGIHGPKSRGPKTTYTDQHMPKQSDLFAERISSSCMLDYWRQICKSEILECVQLFLIVRYTISPTEYTNIQCNKIKIVNVIIFVYKYVVQIQNFIFCLRVTKNNISQHLWLKT